MADRWFYWHDEEIQGPFTGEDLVELAAGGKILPTDLVWREGVERGVTASEVRNLFAAISEPATAVPAEAAAGSPSEAAADNRAGISDVVKDMPQSWFSGAAASQGTRRATAGRGTSIIGQDGTTVKFRMKCTTCGQEDSSYRSLPITRGTIRAMFFCRKCRRNCPVELTGHVS